MILTLKPDADPEAVRRALAARGLWVVRLDGADGPVAFEVRAHSRAVAAGELADLPGVAAVAAPPSPHPRLDAQPERIDVGGLEIGPGAPPVWIAGPCCIESEEQIEATAAAVAAAGARMLRGGAFKPRTSPHEFQGHGLAALDWLAAAARRHGLRTVSEALSERDAEAVAARVDMVQVGSRNMQNFALLRAVGATGRPALLKRGMAATIEEWRLAAEHLLVAGAPGVVFCERGVRGFDPASRNLLDLGAVALLAHVDRLPVVVDPSHALGRRDLVPHLAKAALAAGAAGVMIEVHAAPERALSDGPQALPPDEFAELLREARASGRASA